MHRAMSVTPDRLLDSLSPPQREAVTHTDGPLLILAGPGSGKTRVVTTRAAYLALTVTAPEHILAITFTNKAAREMRERTAALEVARGMTVCTFHALCARLLREYAGQIGIESGFSIVDREDRRKILKKAIEASGLSSDNWPPPVVEADISRAKNNMLTAGEFLALERNWRDRSVARIYECYESALAKLNGLDFDDLLMRVAIALRNSQGLRDELEERFRYVLIDEYQDTNAAQYTIARLLTARRENICATGDPDQSIYAWRGADISNILDFESDYPRARVVFLEQNYRSTRQILAAADTLISGNLRRKEKALWTQNEKGHAIRVAEYEEAADEARAVAEDVKRELLHGIRPEDIAVFYRVNSLSRTIEEALIQAGIKYQVARGVEFYNRKEIKDVLAYMRILANPADDVSLLRIINTPARGIGAASVSRLVVEADEIGIRLFEVLARDEVLERCGRAAEKLRQFRTLLAELAPALELAAPAALARVLSETGLGARYNGEADESEQANVDELINAAASFQREYPLATARDWLEYTALVSDVDGVKSEGGAVTLMTLHAAKGLEFSAVYVVGLEDGIIPLRRRDEETDIEEERRLCFVGITRAKRRLMLSRARYRVLRGVGQCTARSPFLDELPCDQVQWVEGGGGKGRRGEATPLGRLPDDVAEWGIGTLVRHPVRGLGRVVSLQRGAKRTHIGVEFQDGVSQSWVLEFAQLERVEFDDVG